MGVHGLLRWIKKKYPRVVRETPPTFENYDMLFVDIPQYVSLIFRATAKPYSNVSILMCNILSDIDRLVQFSQPSSVIFFSFESINGLLPYAKAILKRFRTITISKNEAKRLAEQKDINEGVVSTEKEDEIEMINVDDLEPGADDEFEEAFKEFSKLGDENKDQIDNSTIIQKVKEMVEKINKNRLKKAKKAKKDKNGGGEEEDIELNEDEIPQLLSIDEFLKTVKRADYDKEIVPDINEFLIEFQKEFNNFVQIKMESDPLYQNKRVIVSSSFVQGEAEHKIMEFLRKESQKEDWDPNTKVCICSMDNDLINLSLQTYIRNITLLNCVNNDLSALLIDIKVLRDSIGIELNATEKELTNRIDDIVMMTILISNDFTPAFPDFPSCSMETLFNLYKEIINENKDFILFKNGKFELESVKYFLNTLIKKTIAPNQKIIDAYLEAFNEKFPNSPVEEMSKSYFETIAWTMYLYKYGIPSYSHYYKYEYAPPLSTAINYVDAIKIPIEKFKNNFEYLSRPVQFVLSGGVKKENIDKKLLEKLKDPNSPVAYMFEKINKKNKKKNKNKKKDDDDDNKNEEEAEAEEKIVPKLIDIELTVKTVKEYEEELNLKSSNVRIDQTVCYFWKNGSIDTQKINLNKGKKKPFTYSDEGVEDSIFEPEFWPIKDDFSMKKAKSMINKMIFFSRPYKVPAVVKEVLKYDDISEEERKAAFSQISFVDPVEELINNSKPKTNKKEKKNRKKKNKKQNKETSETEQTKASETETNENNNDQKEAETNENNIDQKEAEESENEEINNDQTETVDQAAIEEKINELKEKLIFFKVTPLSHYKYKTNKDIIVYAPYVTLVPSESEVKSYQIVPEVEDYVITSEGYVGQIRKIDKSNKKAVIDCNIPNQVVDKKIREIVNHDSENYITEEEFAEQVGITPESVPLIASRLILMPDDCNIAIKFYSTRYNKLMCGYCIQNDDQEFLFAKEAVPIAKKYLNQPKIFKQLIEQSAAQIDKRLEHELDAHLNKEKSKNKSKEPKIKLEEVVGNEELIEEPNTTTDESNPHKTADTINDETPVNNEPITTNTNTANRKQESKQKDTNQHKSDHSNQEKRVNSNQNRGGHSNQERGGKSYNGRGGRGGQFNQERGRGGGQRKGGNNNFMQMIEEKRKLYLNESESDYEEDTFNDITNVQLPTDEETETNPPFSIEIPTAIRGTILTRLDDFFKHHKSVNASIFYPFDSTSLSIESIRKINKVLSKNKNANLGAKAITCSLDQLTEMNEYIETSEVTFKAGDRVVLQKNRGFGFFGNYGTVICANDKKHKAVICLDQPIKPNNCITFTNYRMKNIFSQDCVVEFPYSVLKLVKPI